MASLFDPLVDFYDAARPTYPDELFTALAGFTQPLSGARIVEVGAGTGIATRALRSRGALVLPVDHGAAMLARLQERSPAFPTAVRADAHQLPVRSGWADLVCYAQAWHWTDPPRATAEAARVLRPGGALAVWWNLVQFHGIDWLESQHDRLAAANPAWDRNDRRDRDWRGEFGDLGWSVETAASSWTRSLPVDEYLAWMQSKSYVGAIPDSRRAAFLEGERESLLRTFPSGVVVEPFVTELYVARPPATESTGATSSAESIGSVGGD
jgi:SAM-dependent methyltransferase